MKEGFIPPLEELAIPAAVRLPRLLVGEAAFDLFQRVGGTGAQVREPGLGLDLGYTTLLTELWFVRFVVRA